MNWLLIATLFAGAMAGEVAVEVFAETSATSFLAASDNWFWAFPDDPSASTATLTAENTRNEDQYLQELCGPAKPLTAEARLR